MKKVFGQTVRDIKREVNKKVLKVPSIEQKVLDATSNEPWGPHGLLLADIAQATKNYHEHQLIMGVIWKRINDTGKNWRHVYKALTVLEYLVAHGSERVIDDIREHAYQISTLSDFQYIDSSGRDQGNNVRKKSQSIVVLVNDKERIQEVRQKAAANRDKYRNTSMGNMSQYGSGGYGDRYDDDRFEGRYGNRDDDRNGYRDDERSGRYGDSYGREGDKYSRDYEDRYSRDGSRDDDYQGRGQSATDYHHGSRGRSADLDKDRAYEDDGQYSSRVTAAKADDHSQDGSTEGKRLDRKYSEQNVGAPPSYEEVVSASRSPTYSERDGENSLASAIKASSPPTGATPSHAVTAASPPPAPASPRGAHASAAETKQEVSGFDEFDPRGSFSATPTTSNDLAPATYADTEMDLLGSLSDSFSSNSLALVPATEPIMTPETQASANFNSGPTFAAASSASAILNQSFDDPFGDNPFKAIPSSHSLPAEEQHSASSSSFNHDSSQTFHVHQPAQRAGTEVGSTYADSNYNQPVLSGVQPSPTNPQFVQQELLAANQDIDILADILPPSMPSGYPVPTNQPVTQTGFPSQANQPSLPGLPSPSNQNAPQNIFQAQTGQYPGFSPQFGQPPPQTSRPFQSVESATQAGILPHSMALTFPAQSGQSSQVGFHSQSGQPTYLSGSPSEMGSSLPGSQAPLGGQSALANPPNPRFYGTYQLQEVSTGPDSTNMIPTSSGGPIALHNFHPQIGSAVPLASQFGPQAPPAQPTSNLSPVSSLSTSTGPSVTVPQSSQDKFETKSTVWTDTLSRGLVNLNISGPKTNPLADIGVDFDAINRKEKRMEKPTTAPVTSTVTMGKAMGAGSGMGRAGAGVLRPPPNLMIGPGMNMNGVPGAGIGMAGGYGVTNGVPGAGMGMAGGYGVNQPMVRGMGMGMNMGMGQGMNMQQQAGFLPGTAMPAGYNPMMGAGNYNQRPYGGGY